MPNLMDMLMDEREIEIREIFWKGGWKEGFEEGWEIGWEAGQTTLIEHIVWKRFGARLMEQPKEYEALLHAVRQGEKIDWLDRLYAASSVEELMKSVPAKRRPKPIA